MTSLLPKHPLSRPSRPVHLAHRLIRGLVAWACLAGGIGSAMGGPFDVAVSPSRFELEAKSGTRLGQTLNIYNQSSQSAELSVRTLDWTFSESGALKFFDELRPDSCRPWVTLERRLVKVGARDKVAFRFQVDVPSDAAVGECRFMLAIEGAQPAYESVLQGGSANLSLPINGRIAVAVYVGVNGAQPRLSLQQAETVTQDGQRLPAVTVSNTGLAHGRLDGALDAKDARDLRFELVPDGTPIMPGQTRTIVLQPRVLADQTVPKVTFPITSTGSLDWENGSFKVNAEFR